jgi:pimeloyl-ACP methyl ester carboxylesterase
MKSNYITLNGIKWHYYEVPNEGKPVLVLVHGIIFESRTNWGKIIDELKNDYHIYAVDVKGHGLSEKGKGPEDYLPQIIAEDLYEFYKQVIKKPFVLAGYSLGGNYAMSYAALHQDTLKGLIICESAPQHTLKGFMFIVSSSLSTPKEFKNRQHVIDFYNQRFASKGITNFGEIVEKYCIYEEDGKTKLRFDDAAVKTHLGKMGSERSKYLWDCWKKIKIPILLIMAEKSEFFTGYRRKQMLKTQPHVQYHLLPGAYHTFAIAEPEESAHLIDNFIKSLGGMQK